MDNIANVIQRWWRLYTSTNDLNKIKNTLINSLTSIDLQDLSNKCKSISNKCKGDGAGLFGGCLIDMLLSTFFSEKIIEYEEYRRGESDMKINNVSLSQKKINGKSTIALDWSKNINTNQSKKYFTSHIMIVNLKTEKWWKNLQIINSGIYLIDKNYCRRYIELSSNNKTNSLVSSKNLYKMIQRSINQNMLIELPQPEKNIQEFNILKAFC